MRILSARDVRTALPMKQAVDAMWEAFAAHGRRQVGLPLRTHLDANGLTFLSMPATMHGPSRVGAKLLTIVPDNPGRNLPVIQGLVILFDYQSGKPWGVLDGTSLTAIRTGAVSGLATSLLARDDATRLAMIGAGPQAKTQVEGVCCVRDISEVRVFSRTPEHARRFVARIREEQFAPRRITVSESAADAVAGADIVCTATRSSEPIITAEMISPGTHLNAIGSFTPAMHELDGSLLSVARVVVDDRDAATSEAGELVDAIGRGILKRSGLAELGEIVLNKARGRGDERDITVFKSVGLAVQDLAAGAAAIERAAAVGLGIDIHD
jgi:ornithine cyclodeaminase/alanine dehydrogenase-like protein (mu-crystallin family)